MISDAAQKTFWKILSRTEDEEPRDIFAILDGARVRQLPGYLVQQEADFACLVGGETDPPRSRGRPSSRGSHPARISRNG